MGGEAIPRCIYGQHTQENMDGPGIFVIPAHGRITRENDVFSVPVHAAWESGLAGRVRPSRPASARSFSTLRLNLVLTRGISADFHEGDHIYTVNRYWFRPKFIGSRYCMPMALTIIPRVCRHSACNMPLSTMRYVKRNKIQNPDSN